jgi:hypothetical protein
VSDVFSSGEYNGIAEVARVVVLKETSEIKDLIEEGDPAIVLCVVVCNLRGQVETAQLVRSGQMLGLRRRL